MSAGNMKQTKAVDSRSRAMIQRLIRSERNPSKEVSRKES